MLRDVANNWWSSLVIKIEVEIERFETNVEASKTIKNFARAYYSNSLTNQPALICANCMRTALGFFVFHLT